MENLVRALQESAESEEYGDVVARCDAYLKANPDGDVEVLAVKCACLIHEKEFTAALVIAEASESWLCAAYCLYRQRRLEEALVALDRITVETDTSRHLRAQVLYRLDKFGESATLYDALFGALGDEDDEDLRTNLIAAHAAAWEAKAFRESGGTQQSSGSGARPLEAATLKSASAKMSTFELAYNTATLLIWRNDIDGARAKLEQADAMCRESFEGDDDDEARANLRDELAPVHAQLAYVAQVAGDNVEALERYSVLLRDKPTNPVVMAVVSNNYVALRGDGDLFSSAKRLKTAAAAATQPRLSAVQRHGIAFNRALLLLRMNKREECKRALAQLAKEGGASSADDMDLAGWSELPALILSALHWRNKEWQKADDVLRARCAACPDRCVRARLMQSQMLLQRDELQSALDILTAIGEPTVAHALGTVATLSAIVQAIHADEPAEGTRRAWSLYQNAIAAWEERGLGDDALGPILQAAAAFARKSGLNDACASTNERLVRIDSSNPVYRAALVQALATRDIDAAESHVQQLPDVGAVAIDAAVKLAAQGMPRRRAKAKAIDSSKLAAANQGGPKAAAVAGAAGPSAPAADTIVIDAAKVSVLMWWIRVRRARVHTALSREPSDGAPD